MHRCLISLMMRVKVHSHHPGSTQITMDAASKYSLFKILLNNSMLLPWGNDLIIELEEKLIIKIKIEFCPLLRLQMLNRHG